MITTGFVRNTFVLRKIFTWLNTKIGFVFFNVISTRV